MKMRNDNVSLVNNNIIEKFILVLLMLNNKGIYLFKKILILKKIKTIIIIIKRKRVGFLFFLFNFSLFSLLESFFIVEYIHFYRVIFFAIDFFRYEYYII